MPLRVVVALGLWVIISIVVSTVLDALLVRDRSLFNVQYTYLGSFTLSAIDLLVGMWVVPGVLYLTGRYIDRRLIRDYGLLIDRRWWIDLGAGFALGGALMTGIFLFQVALGWVTITGVFTTQQFGIPAWFVPAWFVLSVFSYLVGSIVEELLYRGLLLTNFAEGFQVEPIGPGGAVAIGVFLTSGFFAITHAMAPNATIVSTVSIGLAGVFLALGYVLTGELAFPIGVHIAWNFFEGNLYGFPISGSGTTSVLTIRQGGIDAVTGGAFGPEAGLLGVGAILLGIAATVAWAKHVRGSTGIHPKISDPELRE
jgi:membrane protease YdiL (CAAX protease family)